MTKYETLHFVQNWIKQGHLIRTHGECRKLLQTAHYRLAADLWMLLQAGDLPGHNLIIIIIFLTFKKFT